MNRIFGEKPVKEPHKKGDNHGTAAGLQAETAVRADFRDAEKDGRHDAARDAGLYGRLHDGKRGLGEERKEESAETVSAEGAA